MSIRPSTDYTQRAIGCIVGSAVGDALGAPFEFGPAGQYSKRFPSPVHGGIGEMIGGGGFGWAPGQFTDDTEMAMVAAESLLACAGFDADDQLVRFRAWGAKAKDVGNLTRSVLGSALPATEAAQSVVRSRQGRNTAGNGSLMRAATGAVYFAGRGQQKTAEAAVALSAVTHADPLCLWAVSIQHELVRLLLDGWTVDAAVESVLGSLSPDALAVYGPLLDRAWSPSSAGPGNGSAMGALAQAVWATRFANSFADAVTTVIDLGDDTDSVAAVTGTLAGAHFGIQVIPTRWLTYVHGFVTQLDGTSRRYDHLDLQNLAMSLIGRPLPTDFADEPPLEPREVSPGLYASNRAGARSAPPDAAMVSLCRIDDSMRRPVRREVFLIDKGVEHNPALVTAIDDSLDSIDALLSEGRQVVVHCHGGRSRTGLVIAAHLMRHGRSLAEATALLADRWPHAHTNNDAFAAELQRRAEWADTTDALIEDRLSVVPDEAWTRLWDALDAALTTDAGPTWRGGERTVTTDAAGIEHPTVSMPWLDIGDELTTLMSCMYEAQLVVPFDWMSWRARSRFAHGIDPDPDAVVSVGDAVRLITTISRADRFCEGEFSAAFSDGTLPRLLDVVRRWHTEIAPTGRHDG